MELGLLDKIFVHAIQLSDKKRSRHLFDIRSKIKISEVYLL